jgi:carbamate kinase
MIKNFEELVKSLQEKENKTVVIAVGHTPSAIEAAILAKKENIANCIMTGDAAFIANYLAENAPEFKEAFELVDTGADLVAGARKAVELVREGRGDLILKGKCDTGTLLKAVLDKEKGLRTGNTMSDVLAYETPERLVLMGDGGFVPLPLGVLNAATEGTMGYMIEQSLQNRLMESGIQRNVMTILSQVVVDKEDPSMKNPSKPVGPFFTKEKADDMAKAYGWTMIEDAGRGYRQVVPSPIPQKIVQGERIKQLIEEGNIVIACGGGGIPVYKEENRFEGIDAVIDKDFASALLALEIGAEKLVILTGVDRVAINFNTPEQKDLETLTIAEAQQYLEDGQFPKGSMGPKIAAAIKFLDNGGKEVLITSIEKIVDAFEGKTGTIITK